MDQTHLLRSLFAAEAAQHAASVSSSPDSLSSSPSTSKIHEVTSSSSVLAQLATNPICAAVQLICASVDTSISSSATTIDDTLAAIDVCQPFTTRLESALLLAEAELLSVSSALTELTESVDAALEQAKGVARGETRLGDWLRRAIAAKKGKKDSNGSGASFLSSSSAQLSQQDLLGVSCQMLTHHKQALVSLANKMAHWRLRVTLCREEVALYKADLFSFGRCGILNCPDDVNDSVKAEARISSFNDGGGGPTILEKGAAASAAVEEGTTKRERRFGLVTGVSLKTMDFMDGVIKMAADTVLDAAGEGVHASSSINSRSLATEGAISSSAAALQRGKVPWAAVITAMDNEYTAEEKARLNAENMVLCTKQAEETAQEAIAIEASVRELSQLTSLVNEKVVEQREQFSILLKNTENAHNYIQKATGEVTKAKESFWTPTRQLIALLWASTLVLLLANWIMR